jgi:hypothetical protein
MRTLRSTAIFLAICLTIAPLAVTNLAAGSANHNGTPAKHGVKPTEGKKKSTNKVVAHVSTITFHKSATSHKVTVHALGGALASSNILKLLAEATAAYPKIVVQNLNINMQGSDIIISIQATNAGKPLDLLVTVTKALKILTIHIAVATQPISVTTGRGGDDDYPVTSGHHHHQPRFPVEPPFHHHPVVPVGPTGATGATGASGASGVSDPSGWYPWGPSGATGVTGVTSVTGVTGVNGTTGVTGVTGVTSPVGPLGWNDDGN